MKTREQRLVRGQEIVAARKLELASDGETDFSAVERIVATIDVRQIIAHAGVIGGQAKRAQATLGLVEDLLSRDLDSEAVKAGKHLFAVLNAYKQIVKSSAKINEQAAFTLKVVQRVKSKLPGGV